jgi:prepilin-type N-terminal cleavage/methylation domain-containing protein
MRCACFFTPGLKFLVKERHFLMARCLLAKNSLVDEDIAVPLVFLERKCAAIRCNETNTEILKMKTRKGFTLIELLVVIAIIGILASMLLPALAKAKTRANRAKCVSNIKQVGSAFKAFAADNDNRYPWLLAEKDKLTQADLDATAALKVSWPFETSTLLAQASIRASLGSAKILVSPLDPDNQGANDAIDLNKVTQTIGVSNGGHSYGVVVGAPLSTPPGKGADESRPKTVLVVTRNVSGPVNGEDALSNQVLNTDLTTADTYALWKGPEKHPGDGRTMASLNSNAGQLCTADGSAKQANDADLQAQAVKHHGELAGNYKGSPSGYLDTPND